MKEIDLDEYNVISKKCDDKALYQKMRDEFAEGRNSYYATLKDVSKKVYGMGVYLPGKELPIVLYHMANSDYEIVKVKPAFGYHRKENETKEERGMLSSLTKKGKEEFLNKFGEKIEKQFE